jgi:hypothetical protein
MQFPSNLTVIDNRPTKEFRTLKRGEAREDGMVFFRYDRNCINGERWVTPDKLCAERGESYSFPPKDNREKRRLSRKLRKEEENRIEIEYRKTLPSNLKFGHVRWDGKIFWCYQKSCRHGERWFTPEKFERRLSEQTMRDAVRRAWKGGESSFEIIGLPPSMAVDVDLYKKAIAQKIFPDQKLERDHMRPLALAKGREDAMRRNHFTNFAYIPKILNRSKGDDEFWDWFKLQSEPVQKCITLQCQYNEKIRCELSET